MAKSVSTINFSVSSASHHYVVELYLQGLLAVRNPVPELSDAAYEELCRKFSIIIGSHVQFKSESGWASIRPYISSTIYKLLSNNEDKIFDLMDIAIDTRKAIINDVVDPKTDDLYEEIEGCQEICIADNNLIVIYYKLIISAKTWQARTTFDTSDVIPTPHHSFIKLIKAVDRIHTVYPLLNKFTSYLVEEAIEPELKLYPLKYKESFSLEKQLKTI